MENLTRRQALSASGLFVGSQLIMTRVGMAAPVFPLQSTSPRSTICPALIDYENKGLAEIAQMTCSHGLRVRDVRATGQKLVFLAKHLDEVGFDDEFRSSATKTAPSSLGHVDSEQIARELRNCGCPVDLWSIARWNDRNPDELLTIKTCLQEVGLSSVLSDFGFELQQSIRLIMMQSGVRAHQVALEFTDSNLHEAPSQNGMSMPLTHLVKELKLIIPVAVAVLASRNEERSPDLSSSRAKIGAFLTLVRLVFAGRQAAKQSLMLA